MVALDDSMLDDEGDVDVAVECMDKVEKGHPRPIIHVASFRVDRQIGIITISHDSVKLWAIDEDRDRKNVSIKESSVLAKWRHAVQSCDVSSDGKYTIVVGLDSIVHEIFLDNVVVHETRDFGYMEALHVSISPLKDTYITSSYSGNLSTVDIGSKSFARREPFSNFKNISCLKFSNDMRYVAIGHTDGVIELYDTVSLKLYHKYEVHSMKIRKIVFLPGEERFLTACDDKLVKMLSLQDLSMNESNRTGKPMRVFSAHNSAVLSLAVDERSGGTRFASGSTKQIFIWHVEISTPISVVPVEHKNLVTGLSFSPSGRHLFSVGDDASICCYRVPASGESSPLPEETEEESQEYYGQPNYDQDHHGHSSRHAIASQEQHYALENVGEIDNQFYSDPQGQGGYEISDPRGSYEQHMEYQPEVQYNEQAYQTHYDPGLHNQQYSNYEQENQYPPHQHHQNENEEIADIDDNGYNPAEN